MGSGRVQADLPPRALERKPALVAVSMAPSPPSGPRPARLVVALIVLAASVVAATAQEPATPDESGRWSLRTSIGFTASPGGFPMTAAFPYAATRHISIGPLVQLSVADDLVILAPPANFEYSFDIPSTNEHLRKLRPFVQAGLGFAFIHKDRRGDDDEGAS